MAPEPTCPDSSGCKQMIHTGGLGGLVFHDLYKETTNKSHRGDLRVTQVPPGGLAVLTLPKHRSSRAHTKSPRWDLSGHQVPPVGLATI